MREKPESQVAVILDESVEISLDEICRVCQIHTELVIELVDAGVVEPRGDEPEQWQFPGPALRRIERALRLQRDLDINLPGVAVVLDLLDEVERLRARVDALEHK
jgi:chaperone modulatory protein CbpM